MTGKEYIFPYVCGDGVYSVYCNIYSTVSFISPFDLPSSLALTNQSIFAKWGGGALFQSWLLFLPSPFFFTGGGRGPAAAVHLLDRLGQRRRQRSKRQDDTDRGLVQSCHRRCALASPVAGASKAPSTSPTLSSSSQSSSPALPATGAGVAGAAAVSTTGAAAAAAATTTAAAGVRRVLDRPRRRRQRREKRGQSGEKNLGGSPR